MFPVQALAATAAAAVVLYAAIPIVAAMDAPDRCGLVPQGIICPEERPRVVEMTPVGR